MSTQIDERVVAMRFDARDFNNNVQSTMTLLDKFKDQLNFKGAQKGLEDISTAADNVRLTGLENAAIAVEAKFSWMTSAIDHGIRKIVDSAWDAGTQLVKSLSIDQVTAGFSKYEEKTKAVQTIMNATGLSIDQVNTELEKLIWFADETSYSFTDMVSNVGKFTSNQIDLDVATKSMMGIANAAGLAGSSVQNASHAMEGFSKAMGKGYMENLNWQWIQTAKMDTAAFKQLLIDAAVEMGTLKQISDGVYETLKGNEVTIADFQSAMKDRWMTNEVMLRGLGEFGDYAEQVFEVCQEKGILASEAMDLLSGSASELGEKAFRASQEAKTFTDAIEAVQDAVSSGWMETFEILFGNYMEAKETWTELTDTLWDIFAASGEVRNEMLKSWAELGGRTVMLDAIRAAYDSILSIVGPLKQAIDEMFPMVTAERLYEITQKVLEFFQSLQLSEEAGYTLTVMVKTLLVPIKLLTEAFGVAVHVIGEIIVIAFHMADAFLYLLATTNPIEDFFRNLFGDERYKTLMTAMSKIISGIAQAFNDVATSVWNFIKGIKESGQINTIFKTLSDILRPIKETLLDAIVSGIDALSKIDFSNFEKFGQTTLGVISDRLKGLSGILSGIIDFIGRIGKAIKDYFTGAGDISAPVKNVNLLKTSFEGLGSVISNIKANFTLDNIFAAASSVGQKLGTVIGGLADAFGRLVERLQPAKILLFAFGTGLTSTMFSLSKALKSFAGIGTAAESVLNSTSTAIQNFGERLKPDKTTQTAKALLLLVGALIALSFIDPSRLMSSVLAIGALATILGTLTAGLGAVEKYLLQGDDMSKVTTAFLKLSTGIALLAAGLALLNTVNVEGLGPKITALIGIIAALGVITTLMSIFAKKDISKNAVIIVAFAISLVSMVNALKKLSEFDSVSLVNSVQSLIILMGLLAIMSRAMGQVKFSGAAGVTLMVFNLFLVMFALNALCNLPINKIVSALPAFLGIMGMLTLLMAATNVAGKNATKAGVFLVALSAAIFVLGQAIKSIGSLDIKVAIQGTAVVAILLDLFGLLTIATSLVGEHTDKMAKALIGMSVALMLLSVCISYLGRLDLKQAVQGSAVVSVLLLVMAGIMKLNSVVIHEGEKFKSAAGSMIAMAFLLGVTVAALALLSLVPDQDSMLKATAALVAVLLSLGVAVKLIEKVEREIPEGSRVAKSGTGIMGAIALLVAVGAAVVIIGTMDLGDNVFTNLGALCAVLIALSVALKILPDFENFHGGKALAAMLELELAIAGLVGIIWLIRDLDPLNALADAAALSVLLLVFAGALRILPDFEDFHGGKALAAMLELELAIGGLAGILWLIRDLDPINALADAAALSALLIALTVALRILPDFEDFHGWEALGAIAGLEMAIAGLSALLIAMNGLDPINALLNAVALSALLVALAGAARLLSGFKDIDVLGAMGTLAILTGCTALLTLILKELEKENITLGIQNSISLGIMVVALAGAARLMAGLQNVDLGAALQAILAAGAAVAAVIALMQFMMLFDWSGAEKVITVIGTIGAAIGEAIGQFVGHIVSAAASNLPEVAGYLLEFINTFASVDPRAAEGALSMASAILAITAAEVLTGIANFVPGLGNSFESFSEEIKVLGPAMQEFAASLEGVNLLAVSMGAAALKTLAETYSEVQGTIQGVVADMISGSSSWETFKEGVKQFGPILKEFGESVKDVEIQPMRDAVAGAKALAEFEEALPKHGGWVQTILGDSNLGTFGFNLAIFGAALVSYSNAITADGGIDTSAIEDSAKAGKALSNLENNLRSHGGGWQFMFGDADLSSFGTNLFLFGCGLKAYSTKITENGGLDVSAIEASVPLGKALADLEKGLGATNGSWQSIFGGKENFKDFGENLHGLGQGLEDYSHHLQNTDIPLIKQSSGVAKALADIESNLTNTGWFSGNTGLDTFGVKLADLGKAFEKYSKSLDNVDISKIVSATTSLRGLSQLGSETFNIGATGLTLLAGSIRDLADSGINDFINQFYESKTRIVNAVNTTLVNATSVLRGSDDLFQVGVTIVTTICDSIDQNGNKLIAPSAALTEYVLKGISARNRDLTLKGTYIVTCIVSGINSKQSAVQSAIEQVMIGACNAAQKNANVYNAGLQVGKYTMQGLIAGVQSKNAELKTTMTNVSQGMINTTKKVLDEHSPSVEFKTIGENAMKGLENGIDGNSKSVMKTMKASMDDLLDQMKSDFEITAEGSQVMKNQIGVYLVKGIADGITTDTSAEEAAKKKAENIVNAFKTAADAASREGENANLLYSIWTNRYGSTATKEELAEMEQKNQEANLSAKAKELSAGYATLQTLLSEGYAKDSEEYQEQYTAVLKLEDEYGKLINTYIEAFSPSGVTAQNKMDEITDMINGYTHEIQVAQDQYDIWYNQYGAKASEDELRRKQEELLQARLESAGKTVSAKKAMLEVVLNAFGEDSQEYIDANDDLSASIIDYQGIINEYIAAVRPDTLLMNQLDKSISTYSDAAEMADLNYKMWYNQYGSAASEQELLDMKKGNLEAKLEQAGKTVAANEQILALIAKEYGEDSQEYMDANLTLGKSITSFQELINEYMEMVNPVTTEATDIAQAYQDAAAKYRELMGDKAWVQSMIDLGYTMEELQEWASERSGLSAIQNPPKVSVTYDELYSQYKPKIDLDTSLQNIDYEDIYDEYIPPIQIDLDFDESVQKLDFDELWRNFLPDEIAVQIDPLGAVVAQATEKTTKEAAHAGTSAGVSSGVSSGVKSGVKSGASSAAASIAGDPDILKSANTIGDILGTEMEAPLAARVEEALKAAGFSLQGFSISDILSGMSDLNISSFSGSLDNIVQGIVQGLMNRADDAKSAFSNFASGLLGSFNSALGIHSPSTEMIDSVGYMVEGLVIGFEDNFAIAEAVMTRFADVVLHAVTSNGNEIIDLGTIFADCITNNFTSTISSYETQFYAAGMSIADAIVDGLIDGVRNRQIDAINAVVRLASEMYQEAVSAMNVGGMEISTAKLYGAVGDSRSTTNSYMDQLKYMLEDGAVDPSNYGIVVQELNWTGNGETPYQVSDATLNKLLDIVAETSQSKAASINAAMGSLNLDTKLQNGTTPGSNSTVYNFYQTNNSPTALSRIDIYRDTKNLLSSAKGVT